MTPEDEFNHAAQAAEDSLKRYPVEGIDTAGTLETLLHGMRSIMVWRHKTGIDAAAMARNLAAAIKVLLATRTLMSSGEETRRFASALLVLQAEYMDARNRALKVSASRYVITAALRAQTQALTQAYNKVKANSTAMAQVADSLNGISALISALA